MYIKHRVRFPSVRMSTREPHRFSVHPNCQTIRGPACQALSHKRAKNGCQGRATTEHGSYARTVSARKRPVKDMGYLRAGWCWYRLQVCASIAQSTRIGRASLGSHLLFMHFRRHGYESARIKFVVWVQPDDHRGMNRYVVCPKKLVRSELSLDFISMFSSFNAVNTSQTWTLMV